MGSNFHSPRWTLPENERSLLREALKRDVNHDKARREQRELIRGICSSPEAQMLPPEQFFVSFKQALTGAANDLDIAPGREREELLSRLVSISIEEFFNGNGRANGDGQADVAPSKDRVILPGSRQRAIGRFIRRKDGDCRGTR